RTVVPVGQFDVGTFADAAIPPCNAVTAIGEVLNYGTREQLAPFFRRAAEALQPNGILIFDVAERGSYPEHDERRIGGDDWSVIAIKDSDGERLTRRVLTFRQIDGETRRSEEVHRLELYERGDVLRMLREAGFATRVRRSYGTRRLPKGHAVFVLRLLLPRRA
ncbi:MAG TPA: hypothetical protein VG106_08300, partial [Vicinamibacterales bacterium]|nr:hypothetical protein [Vicinamibacterales bacterium]